MVYLDDTLTLRDSLIMIFWDSSYNLLSVWYCLTFIRHSYISTLKFTENYDCYHRTVFS